MEKKSIMQRTKETPIGIILVLLLLFILITTLPVLVNALVKIDWFKDSVSGGEGDWLSFYGSYLGGILGGILTLVGVVLTIRYQDRTRTREIQVQAQRKQYIMDALLERACWSLLNFIILSTDKSALGNEYINGIRAEKKNYNEIMKEIDVFHVESLPHRVLIAFTAIREDLKGFNIKINYIFERRISSDSYLYHELESLDIKGLLKFVLTIHREFAVRTNTIEFILKELETLKLEEELNL